MSQKTSSAYKLAAKGRSRNFRNPKLASRIAQQNRDAAAIRKCTLIPPSKAELRILAEELTGQRPATHISLGRRTKNAAPEKIPSEEIEKRFVPVKFRP
jgi:hypothetical protein